MATRTWLALTCLPLAISLAPADYARLKTGVPIVEVLPAKGRNIALRAATRIDVTADRLATWTRHIEELQRGPYVVAIGRFSDPPRIDDLDGLSLDGEDLSDLRRCRVADCGLKLDDAEIADIRRAIAAADENWHQAAQTAFRNLLFARVEQYLAEGHGPAFYHDEHRPVQLGVEFAAIAAEIARTQPHLLPVTDYLSDYPRGDAGGVESFLYWSKELLGAKPIVSVTHVAIMENRNAREPEALVAKKQVYASHYITASLSFTSISATPSGGDRNLVYLNHSRSDVLDGVFARFIRRVIQRRLRAEGPRALLALRQRLESGEP